MAKIIETTHRDQTNVAIQAQPIRTRLLKKILGPNLKRTGLLSPLFSNKEKTD